MDSDIGGILENLWGGDAQKNSLFCVRFRTLRYSKASKISKCPANALKINYFFALVTGSDKVLMICVNLV